MTSTLFTAAIVLGAVFVFVLFFNLLHKKGKNKKLVMQKITIADLVWKNKLEINEQEIINDYFLGIDKINFVLIYMDFHNDTPMPQIIDLWHILSAKLKTETKSIYEEKKGKSILVDKIVDNLSVEVSFIDSVNQETLLLYQFRDGMQDLQYINQRAHYWTGIINKSVNEISFKAKETMHDFYVK